ncbi:phosphoglycerate dehydrogenase [Lysinibacillus sp. FSL H8-0500]|uniref:Phosphoglycerate dehydrogenase n=1 Tax=Lysinibacillus macroides TaxID=33935 RepID=A0A0M9DLL9_9BACI|nr:phosphoglycerate dehydrogenase [Lysinibacillus macroides]KOY82916.1 phosphoglycerate dehydrogenase [Lysinibacillus macroides]
MSKILITPKSFQKYKEKPIEMLTAMGYEVIENTTGKTLTEEQLLSFAEQEIVGIIVGVDPLTKEVLQQFPHLKAISKYGVGMDNIDLHVATSLGIKVDNARDTNNISVCELAIALMFECARKLSPTIQGVKQFGWDRFIGIELTGKHLLIVGGGKIGKEVAKRAKGLAMEVTIYDPYMQDEAFLQTYQINYTTNFEEAIQQADIVSLHLPATAETRHLMNADIFEKMKPSAMLINTARGELVNEQALLTALEQGQIAVAAQDVYSAEPPEVGDALVQLNNFILTPHIGAYTEEAVERMAIVSTQNIINLLNEQE